MNKKITIAIDAMGGENLLQKSDLFIYQKN